MVAFQTTEARLPFWIKALLCRYHESPKYNVKQDLTETCWTEFDDLDQPYKCEKVILEIILRKALMITITVYISTGGIHVFGRFFKEWGGDEFENIVKMVNIWDEEMKIEHDKLFLEIITRGKSKTCAVDKQNTSTENSQTMPVNSPRDKTFTVIKQHLSNLKVDYTSFKEDKNTKIKQLNETIEKKGENITLLNSEIM